MIRTRQADGWTDRRKDTTSCKDAKSHLKVKRIVSLALMLCIVDARANIGDSEYRNPFYFNRENHKLEKLRERMISGWFMRGNKNAKEEE